MFSKIMVPIDLAHVEAIDKSLKTAAQLARLWEASLCYVAVVGSQPGRVARSPVEFAARLKAFARERGERYGIETDARVFPSHDVAADLDVKLLKAIDEVGADLVVMASHVPGVPDRLHLMSSNAARIVRQARVSVMVVRPDRG